MNPTPKQKTSWLEKISAPFTGADHLRAERARLEAFLDAFPGEYCGWAADGSLAYSQGFCKILGTDHIDGLSDIQNILSANDSAALEGMFSRLKSDGIAFELRAQSFDRDKTLKITGRDGKDLSGQDRFIVLWLEDITKQARHERDNKEREIITRSRLMRLQNAFGAAPFGAWLRSADTLDLIWCNSSYSSFFDLSPEETLAEQKEITQGSKKPGKDKILTGRDLASAAAEEQEPLSSETHMIIGGKRLLMRITETPLPDYNIILGLAEDITRHEELETELHRYQRSNKELLGQLRSAIGLFGANQKLEFYNSAFSELWKVEEQWLNTRPKLGEWMEKLRAERKLPEQADFKNFKQGWIDMFTSLIEPYEDMLYLPDGGALRMLVVPHSEGGLMMTFEDVTSRLELESSYNTLIAVQQETLDNLGEAVSVYGGDGRLKLWNPSFSRLWQLSPEDLEGDPHVSKIVSKLENLFTPQEWPARREELISKALDRIMHEGRLKRADDVHIDYATVPLPDGGVLITYNDVSDSVRVENALREKNKALEAAEKLKIDFLANVSYQLRTPLNAIIGFNEILDQEYFGPMNERQKEYTSDIKNASHRLLSLIDDILDLSTIEAGYMVLDRKPVKICEMLETIFQILQSWAQKEKLKISLKCPKNIGSYHGDERRLKQALMNVIRNAIMFTPSGGSIDITASRKKDHLEIKVADTGIGIAREQQIRIFEPFERAKSGGESKFTTTQSRSGAGLGLSLVKNIISLHGGAVELDSDLGKGTSVTIKLPIE